MVSLLTLFANLCVFASAIDDSGVQSILRDELHWGFGEKQYKVAGGGDGSTLIQHLLRLQSVGGAVLTAWETLATECDGRMTAPLAFTIAACRERLSGARRLLQALSASVASEATAQESSKDVQDSYGPMLDDPGAIVAYHMKKAARLLNSTHSMLARASADFMSPGLVVAALAGLVEKFSRRVELMRWHITYCLFLNFFARDTPPLIFHEFCCSNAEIIFQVAMSNGILDTPSNASHGESPWSATIVEVGVETGSTSRSLLDMLPHAVRLIGVDPFCYDDARSDVSRNVLAAYEVEIRASTQLRNRYDSSWLQEMAANVEMFYSNAHPPGRAHLVRQASPEATKDPSFSSAGGVDLVFIDGDHSYEAVKKDLQAWLGVLQSQRHQGDAQAPERRGRRRILAGHDFTIMFPGVAWNVVELAESLHQVGLDAQHTYAAENKIHSLPQSNAGPGFTIHLAANAIWWLSVP